MWHRGTLGDRLCQNQATASILNCAHPWTGIHDFFKYPLQKSDWTTTEGTGWTVAVSQQFGPKNPQKSIFLRDRESTQEGCFFAQTAHTHLCCGLCQCSLSLVFKSCEKFQKYDRCCGNLHACRHSGDTVRIHLKSSDLWCKIKARIEECWQGCVSCYLLKNKILTFWVHCQKRQRPYNITWRMPITLILSKQFGDLNVLLAALLHVLSNRLGISWLLFWVSTQR